MNKKYVCTRLSKGVANEGKDQEKRICVASEQEVCPSSETRHWEEKQELQVKPAGVEESEESKDIDRLHVLGNPKKVCKDIDRLHFLENLEDGKTQ